MIDELISILQVVIEEGIKIAETAGGPEAKPIIQLYKKHGVIVIHKTTVSPIADTLCSFAAPSSSASITTPASSSLRITLLTGTYVHSLSDTPNPP